MIDALLMNRLLPIISVFLAAAAFLVVVFGLGGKSQPLPTVGSESSISSLAAQIEDYRKDLEALKDSHHLFEERLATAEKTGSPANESPEIVRLRQRINELEAGQAQLTQLTRDIDKNGVISGLEKELLKANSILMDTNQPVATRLRQTETLKRSGHFDERAVKVVTDLYGQTGNYMEKAGVLNALSGVLVPELRDQILDDLSAVVKAGYTDPRFRYTAIGALEPMVKDPEVQLWLGHLAQNDPEPKLAERAGQLIGTVPPATTTPPAAPLPGKR